MLPAPGEIVDLLGFERRIRDLAERARGRQLNADDIAWINRCINDNKNEPGGTPDVVRKYCMCMNEKMGTNETQSISTWEKTHAAERQACDKEAGWK